MFQRGARTRWQLSSLIFVTGIAAGHEDAPHHEAGNEHRGGATPAVAAVPEPIAQRVVIVDKATQRSAGLRTALVPITAAPRELPGRVIADPVHSERIAATQTGTLEIAPGAKPGQRVEAGTVLAWLTPALPATLRADVGSELAIAKRDQSIGRLQIDRYNIDEAPQFEVKLPTPTLQILTEYRSAKGRTVAYDRALPKPEALRAPHAGRLLRGPAAAGRLVQPGELLFEIDTPDAAAVAVEYIDDDLDAAAAVRAHDSEGHAFALRHLGDGYDAVTRTHRALYAVASGQDVTPAINSSLVVEMPPQVAMPALRVPARAVSRDTGGHAMVWIHRSAEAFAAREVVVLPVDDETVRVTAGIAAGERIVISGTSAFASQAAR